MTFCLFIKIMWPYIRRIAYHHIEASFLEDLREFLLPVEGLVASYGWVADERVATLDVLVQRVQLAVGLGGAQPECQLSYADTLFIDIYTVEVVLKDIVLYILELKAVT